MQAIFEDGAVVDAGIDWVTASAKEGRSCAQLLALGERVKDGQEGRGFFSTVRGFQGYRGYGFEGGFVGTKEGSVVLRLSGDLAHQHAVDVLDTRAKITRCDIQIGVQLPDDDIGAARRLVDGLRERSSFDADDPKLHTKLVDGGRDGSTAYAGKRSQTRYTRIYDKHRESSGSYPAGYWRIEVECKRRLADPLYRKLGEWTFNRERLIGWVAGHLYSLGVRLPCAQIPFVRSPVVPRVVSDVDRKLKWLRDTVMPVVRQMHEAGYHEEATDALYSWLRTDGPVDA